MMPARAGQRGYTLVEVIVAFAVLALALVLLLGTLSGATRQVRGADDAGRAALHAQSLLAELGVSVPLQPGRRQGEFDGGDYRWALDMRPYRDPTLPEGQPVLPAAPQLLEIGLSVRWGERPGERIEVRSLRLVSPGAMRGDGP